MAKRKKEVEGQKPPTSKFNIVIDTREQLNWSFNKSDWCGGTISKKLDQGDYSIEGFESLISVERKRSTGEIATNVFEKRFENELERMSDLITHPFIICEFDFRALKSFPEGSGIPRSRWGLLKVSSPLILKSISIFQLKYHKVKWIFAGNTEFAREHCRSLMKTALQLSGNLPC